MTAKREDAYLSVKNQRRIPHWERLPFTGLGARATADMAGKRPLRASGPMMSALILWPFLIKKKGRKKMPADIDARLAFCP